MSYQPPSLAALDLDELHRRLVNTSPHGKAQMNAYWAYGDLLEEVARHRALLQEAEDAGAAKEAELGKLYATIFGDGGHRQAELRGQVVEEIDWLDSTPTGRMIPALPFRAIEVIGAKNRLIHEAEAENGRLLAKLAQEGEQEKQLLQRDEELRKLQEVLNAGDPLEALMRLSAHFHEAGNTAAWSNVRAAAHNIGFCLDSSGADAIEPTEDECPLCGYDAAEHPEPLSEEAKRFGRIGKYLFRQPEDQGTAPVAPEAGKGESDE